MEDQNEIFKQLNICEYTIEERFFSRRNDVCKLHARRMDGGDFFIVLKKFTCGNIQDEFMVINALQGIRVPKILAKSGNTFCLEYINGPTLLSAFEASEAKCEPCNELLKKFVDFLKSFYDSMIYTSDMVYSNKGNPKMQKFENLNKLLSADLQLPINGVDKSIIENIDDIKVLKVLLICHNDEETESLQKYFSKYDTLTAVSSARGLLDIMASDTSKGNALKILSEKTGVDLSKAIAFGDNYNDIEMLKCVGMPIAMGNSVEDVKSCILLAGQWVQQTYHQQVRKNKSLYSSG